MKTDFSVLRGYLAEARRRRKKDIGQRLAAAVDLHFAGVRALNIYHLAAIADELDVSVDWLLGRSDGMELSDAKAGRYPARAPEASLVRSAK